MAKLRYVRISEEGANVLTHGAGLLFGLISVPLLIWQSVDDHSFQVTTGAGIYGLSFLAVFLSSTLFHFQQPGTLRNRLKILDHISIYFLIAGTYTPIVLLFVQNEFGYLLLYVLWGLTALGVIFKIFFTGRFEWLSIIIYVAMGWMLFAGGARFFDNMPNNVIYLIIIGGITYMLGIVFYIHPWFRYHHAVWHLFSLAGAVCHYSAIALSI